MNRKVISVFSLIFCTLVSGSFAATYLAASFNYAPFLGAPLFSVGRYHIYPVWKLLQWLNILPRDQISAALLKLMIGVLVGMIMPLIFFFLEQKAKDAKKSIFGDAAWASLKEIKNAGLLGGTGVFLGKLKDGRYLRHDGPDHYAIIAPTRSGKGAGIVVPTLCTWQGSVIVYDMKKENFNRTARRRSEFSDVIYFAPGSVESAHFNPLFEIRKGIHEVKDAQNIANMIIEPDKPGQSDHWTRTGTSLITAAILHLLYAGDPSEMNLAGVANLLSRPEMSLTETLQEMLETKHIRDEDGTPLHPHPGVAAAVRDVLNKSPDDKSSVVSTIMGYLAVYRDPLLANCTRDSDFTIDELVNGERPKSLYFVLPPADIDRLRPIIRLIVNLICRRLTETTDLSSIQSRHKLLLLLDEFPALGRLEFFETALAFIAGYGLKAMLVCQSINQLRQAYGERTSILDNTHVRVFYQPNTIETAEYLSRTLGDSTVEYTTKGESGKKGSPFNSSKSQSDHVSRRQLMTPREVMELSKDEEIVLVGGAKPIKCLKSMYFTDNNFIPLTDEKNPLEINRDPSAVKNNEWIAYSKVDEDDFDSPLDEIDPSATSEQFESREPDSKGLVVTEIEQGDSDDETEEESYFA